MTGPATVPAVDERVAVDDTTGDHDRFSHIVWSPGKDGRAAVLEARVTGTPVRALCGKLWVPDRDPQRFPLCRDCRRIAESAGLAVPTS